MKLLIVDSAGLQTLAATCENLAAGITSSRIPACRTPSYQATSAAVSVIHNGVATASELLAQRMQSTAVDLRNAGRQYAATEMNSADEIRHISGSV